MTVPQCCPQGFQSCDVTREFENSQYSEDPEDLSSFSNVFNAVSRVEQGQDKRHVEGEDPKEVNYIEEGNNEEKLKSLSVRLTRSSKYDNNSDICLLWSHHVSDEVLQGEPTNEYPFSNSEEDNFFNIVVCSDLLWDYCCKILHELIKHKY